MNILSRLIYRKDGRAHGKGPNKKFELRDSVVKSKNGSPIGSYKVVYMKTNFILRDFYPNDLDAAIGIRKNDTKSFMYHVLTFIKHFSREFLLDAVAGFEKVETISKVEHHKLAHLCPQGYKMSIKNL